MSAFSLRDHNGNLNLSDIITYLTLYFKKSEIEMIVDTIKTIDFKLQDRKK